MIKKYKNYTNVLPMSMQINLPCKGVFATITVSNSIDPVSWQCVPLVVKNLFLPCIIFVSDILGGYI